MSNVIRVSYSRAEDGSLIRSKPCKISRTSGSIKISPMLLKASWKKNSVNSWKVHSSLRFKWKSSMKLINLISCLLEIVSLIDDGSRRLSHKRTQSKRNSGLYATPPTLLGRCIKPERTWVAIDGFSKVLFPKSVFLQSMMQCIVCTCARHLSQCIAFAVSTATLKKTKMIFKFQKSKEKIDDIKS